MRIRLNQEYRNKVAVKMKSYNEQEDTQEKEDFFQMTKMISMFLNILTLN